MWFTWICLYAPFMVLPCLLALLGHNSHWTAADVFAPNTGQLIEGSGVLKLFNSQFSLLISFDLKNVFHFLNIWDQCDTWTWRVSVMLQSYKCISHRLYWIPSISGKTSSPTQHHWQPQTTAKHRPVCLAFGSFCESSLPVLWRLSELV